jgi:type III restriction enzyme
MTDQFFERPIINSPYEYPAQHWDLDASGQPTGQLIPSRRRAQFVVPIPKPKKRRAQQEELFFEDATGLSSAEQAYDPTPIINELTKAGAYGRLDQKQITAWLDLRNKAAHGHYDQYSHAQVQGLVAGIREFVTRVPIPARHERSSSGSKQE